MIKIEQHIAIVLALAVVAAVAIESPEYTVVSKLTRTMDIRQYNSTMWVSTQVANVSVKEVKSLKGRMFWKLFSYISGKENADKKKIAMTAPVVTRLDAIDNSTVGINSRCNVTMSFFVSPSQQANIPQPTNSEVYIDEMPAMNVAVIRFGWYPQIDDYLVAREVLVKKLANASVEYDTNNFATAGYDSPSKFWRRRNELWLIKKD